MARAATQTGWQSEIVSFGDGPGFFADGLRNELGDALVKDGGSDFGEAQRLSWNPGASAGISLHLNAAEKLTLRQ